MTSKLKVTALTLVALSLLGYWAWNYAQEAASDRVADVFEENDLDLFLDYEEVSYNPVSGRLVLHDLRLDTERLAEEVAIPQLIELSKKHDEIRVGTLEILDYEISKGLLVGFHWKLHLPDIDMLELLSPYSETSLLPYNNRSEAGTVPLIALGYDSIGMDLEVEYELDEDDNELRVRIEYGFRNAVSIDQGVVLGSLEPRLIAVFRKMARSNGGESMLQQVQSVVEGVGKYGERVKLKSGFMSIKNDGLYQRASQMGAVERNALPSEGGAKETEQKIYQQQMAEQIVVMKDAGWKKRDIEALVEAASSFIDDPRQIRFEVGFGNGVRLAEFAEARGDSKRMERIWRKAEINIGN